MKLPLFVAASLAMTAGSVIAQEKGSVPRFIVRWPSVELVHFAAIETVQKDLGVSDEVARKLTLLRDNYRATYQKECQDADILQSPGPLNPLSPKLREIGRKLDDEFIPKVNELLSADQQKRFRQIRFRGGLGNNFPKALLDAASDLKLTEDQQEKLKALDGERRQEQIPRGRGGAGERERYLKVQEKYSQKATEVLTADQKATLDELKGSDFDTSQLVVR